MTGRLRNKTALITGAANGLGLAIAKRFINEGANVVAFDNNANALKQNFRKNDNVEPLHGDTCSIDDLKLATEVVQNRFGQLDILIPNAGIYDQRLKLADISLADLPTSFEELFSINVLGALLAAKSCINSLKSSNGTIIFTSSISGEQAGFGGPLYVASKHAINGLTRQLALELAPAIRVNAVAPGYIPTHIRGLKSLSQDKSLPQTDGSKRLLKIIPAIEHYAAAYVLLASDETASIATGTIIQLDGGSSLTGPSS